MRPSLRHNPHIPDFQGKIMEVMTHINWDLLAKQKAALVHLMAHAKKHSKVDYALTGVVTLFDFMQDAAEEAGVWKPGKNYSFRGLRVKDLRGE